MAERQAGKPNGQAHASGGSRKMMMKLLRMLVRGRGSLGEAGGDRLRLTRDNEAAEFPAALVALAVSRGLALARDGGLEATPAAAAFLRRVLAGGEAEFAAQHRDMVEETALVEGARQPVRRNLSESPLMPLARLKDRDGQPFLPPAAFDAGERLLADFTRGQMQPRITATWEPRLETGSGRRSGGAAEIGDIAMAARDRFTRAVAAMGPELAGVAIDICCFGKGLETVERERQWPARSAKLMLRTALLSLARHYAPPATGGARKHHWGDADFRPRM